MKILKIAISFLKPRNLIITLFSLLVFVVTCSLFASFKLISIPQFDATIEQSTYNFIIFFAFSAIFSLLCLSPMGEWFYRKPFNSYLLPENDDTAKMIEIFNKVYEKALINSPNLSKKVGLYYYDSNEINAFALGTRTVSISTALLDVENSEVIEGLFAHEFAHLANYDSFRSIAISSSSILLFLFVFAAGLFVTLAGVLIQSTKNMQVVRILIIIFILPFALFALMIFIFNFLIKIISTFLEILSSRACEYAADAYAVKLGFGSGLLTLFQYFESSEDKKSVFDFFSSTHPYSENRTKRVVEAMQTQD